MRSGAAWLACAPPETVETFLSGLSEGALLALPYLFEFWALDHQMPPEGDWRTRVIMGGRGAGKTRAGAEWVRAQVEGPLPTDPGRARRVALVGETIEQTRKAMVFGESGILACSPPDRRPEWQATRKRLVWPNGAVAQVFSTHEPDGLRGPQLVAAARVLFATPEAMREAVLHDLLQQTEWADAHRRKTGRAHPHWGDGSLMCAALKRRPPPEPSLEDDNYCACLAQVLEGLADWRCGGTVRRPARRRCRWTPWGRVQAV